MKDNISENLEKFILAFNSFEKKNKLFYICIDSEGFKWWDIVRYDVQFALCEFNGIYSYPLKTYEDLGLKIIRLTRKFFNLIGYFIKFYFMKKNQYEKIFIFNRNLFCINQEINKFKFQSFLITNNELINQNFLKKESIDFIIKLLSRFVFVPKSLRSEFKYIDQKINNNFNTEIDFVGIFTENYKKFKSSYFIWKNILKRFKNLNYVGLINDGSLKSVCYLTNKLNIISQEFQHSIIAPNHIGYMYPKVYENILTLPSEIILTRNDFEVNYPVKSKFYKQNNNKKNKSKDFTKDIDLLIGTSRVIYSNLRILIEELQKNNISFSIKLHPAQTKNDFLSTINSKNKNFEIFAGNEDFIELAKRTKIYIPCNPTSSTVIEASENGALVYILEKSKELITISTNKYVDKYFHEIDQLSDAIKLII